MYSDFGMVFYVKVEVVLIFLEEILQNLQIVWKNNESLVQTNASKPYIYSNLLLYFQISTVLWRKMAETRREQHKYDMQLVINDYCIILNRFVRK